MTQPNGLGDKVAFVWKVPAKQRGPLEPHEYGSLVLPLPVLRRLDAVLEPSKAKVLSAAQGREGNGDARALLRKAASTQSYNTSPLTSITPPDGDYPI